MFYNQEKPTGDLKYTTTDSLKKQLAGQLYKKPDNISDRSKKGIGKDNADKNFNILEQYKMPISTGLIIDTGNDLLPLNRMAYHCPVGLIGL